MCLERKPLLDLLGGILRGFCRSECFTKLAKEVRPGGRQEGLEVI